MDKATVNISRPATSNTPSGQTSVSDLPRVRDAPHYTEPLSEDEDEDEDALRAVATDESGAVGLPEDARSAAEEAKKFRETHKEETKSSTQEEANGFVEQFAKLTPQNLERLLKAKYESGPPADRVVEDDPLVEPPNSSTIKVPEYVTSFRAQPGKRVVVPIRIEPKVYFANERTYLVSFGLRLSRPCGLAYILVGMGRVCRPALRSGHRCSQFCTRRRSRRSRSGHCLYCDCFVGHSLRYGHLFVARNKDQVGYLTKYLNAI